MFIRKWTSLIALAFAMLSPGLAAADAAPPAAAPLTTLASLEQRVKDLEAAATNGSVSVAATQAEKDARPLNNQPDSGHNGFMMICAALVLFMTLPGLFLFYGGLVRAKNVLSDRRAVHRPCRHGRPHVVGVRIQPRVRHEFQGESPRARALPRRHRIPFHEGCHFGPEHELRLLGLAERLLDVPDDVRDHHSGADCRCHRRADEVFGRYAFFGYLDARGLLSNGPHGLGRDRPDERRLEP